ncbi:NAD(P)H-dependent oxidoreductase [Nostoc sp. CHAB 5824]|nr:NAD(P)H-dependent oxidoreductase [Nostoc sp. CHAB 5824]
MKLIFGQCLQRIKKIFQFVPPQLQCLTSRCFGNDFQSDFVWIIKKYCVIFRLPIVVKDWCTLLEKSDGVLISTPEYAYGMPGVLKNALDWIVPSGELIDKPVATISASPSELGGSKAHASLMLTLTALAANLIESGSVTIPFVGKKLNANGELTDMNTVQSLKFLLDALVQAIEAHR